MALLIHGLANLRVSDPSSPKSPFLRRQRGNAHSYERRASNPILLMGFNH
ncbi:hypothetical protein VIBHAR_06467 [Vibrio campbellii ATCC BAA-1116]|uniref:Uncharacterized protein n=1 Tax=Vibrio campbellii (strain ATCC BAA-1116) TaxID=2902295 RepID=A7N863_VIBC1|nr:hypothetical protein VIBHAR_06467 [Vibrio campbellii ATCC BAA-1116]